jgi:predicted aconitase
MCGITPNYGLHLDENRRPDFLVNVDTDLVFNADFGAMGYFIGTAVKNKIPYFTGIKHAHTDHLKALGAAMAASGAVALYHIEGMTPEANSMEIDGLERIEFGKRELKETYEKLNSGEDSDIIIVGCPHASLREIIDIASFLDKKKLKKPLWICTSKATKETAKRMELEETIEKAGGKIVSDTCMVVSPIEELFTTTAVNSGKAAHYLPSFCRQKVVFKNLYALLEEE